jgi:hypothetical protein
MNFNPAQPFDQPIGSFCVHMIVSKAERANDPDMRAVLGGPVLEHDMVELVGRDGKRLVATSVPRTTRLSRFMAKLARSEPARSELINDIRNSIAHHGRQSPPHEFGKNSSLL